MLRRGGKPGGIGPVASIVKDSQDFLAPGDQMSPRRLVIVGLLTLGLFLAGPVALAPVASAGPTEVCNNAGGAAKSVCVLVDCIRGAKICHVIVDP